MFIDILIIALIAIIVISSGLISGTYPIIDESKSGYKKLTISGKAFTIINLFLIGLLIYQYVRNVETLSEKEEAAEEKVIEANKKYEKLLKENIRELRNDFNNSLKEIIIEYNKTTVLLAEYGYKVDIANKKLIKLVEDSVKSKVILPSNPVITCTDFKFKKKLNDSESMYSLFFRVADGSASNFDITSYLIGEDSFENLEYYGEAPLLSKTSIVSKNQNIETFWPITIKDKHIKLYFRIEGTYSNIDCSKQFKVNEVYYYGLKGKQFYTSSGKTKERVINFIDNLK